MLVEMILEPSSYQGFFFFFEWRHFEGFSHWWGLIFIYVEAPSSGMQKKFAAGALVLVLVVVYLLAPVIVPEEQLDVPEVPPNSALEYFGFALVDTYFNDPHDQEVKENYADEVTGFTNMAHMSLGSLTEDITGRLDVFRTYGLGAILHVQNLFFVEVSSDGVRADLDLRVDYAEIWETFVLTNSLRERSSDIAVFYLVDEPYWNHVTFEELNLTASLVKGSFPDVPVLLIEAYAALDEFKVPAAVDWIGFDRYDTVDPTTDPSYQADWARIVELAEAQNDSVIVVMDAQWREYYQWEGGIRPEDMGTIALNYYRLSLSNDRVVGIIGYLWPGGLDSANQLGARDLPENVQSVYQQIGYAIVGT